LNWNLEWNWGREDSTWAGEECCMRWRRFDVDCTVCEICSATMAFAVSPVEAEPCVDIFRHNDLRLLAVGGSCRRRCIFSSLLLFTAIIFYFYFLLLVICNCYFVCDGFGSSPIIHLMFWSCGNPNHWFNFLLSLLKYFFAFYNLPTIGWRKEEITW
jgi:hypothetical protein